MLLGAMHILVAMLMLSSCSALRDHKSSDNDIREGISWPNLAEMQEKMEKKPHPEGHPSWVAKKSFSDEEINHVQSIVWACYNDDDFSMASCITWQMDFSHTVPKKNWGTVVGKHLSGVSIGPPVRAQLIWGDLVIFVFGY
mmetsp:Transcript_40262/g.94326  ORF Transcript_40262/g.94326 Transcript_40262/m.94326 type:complete len:141 (+) Transcript_40262:88-510(+)